jgi:hypothetical protein
MANICATNSSCEVDVLQPPRGIIEKLIEIFMNHINDGCFQAFAWQRIIYDYYKINRR